MSLTVIQYADTVRLTVMADARLSPSHSIPAARWPVIVDKLVNKINQEIARITAQAQSPLEHVSPKKSSKENLDSSYEGKSCRVEESSHADESSYTGESYTTGESSQVEKSSKVEAAPTN